MSAIATFEKLIAAGCSLYMDLEQHYTQWRHLVVMISHFNVF